MMTNATENRLGIAKRLTALLLTLVIVAGFLPNTAFDQGGTAPGTSDTAPGIGDTAPGTGGLPIGLSGLMLAMAPPAGLPEVDAYWPNFRGNDTNMAITDVPLPIDSANINLKWNKLYGPSWTDWNKAPSIQIIVDDALVLMSENSLFKLNLDTGDTIAEGRMVSTPSYGYTSPLYAAGMIFCSLEGGIVQAFNAETLESLWVYTDPLGGQAQMQMAYSDGYLYSGFWNSETSDANLVSLPITDENPTQTIEAKSAQWVFTNEGGFYWAGGAVVGDALIVGGDNGSKAADDPSHIYSFNKLTGELINSLEIKGDQRSSIAYDRDSGRVYFTTKAGYLYSAEVDYAGGELSDLREGNQNGSSTSTPLVYKDRVYLAMQVKGFGRGSFAVADADTLEQLYVIELKGYPQCSMLMTTAYEETTGYIYLYSTYNNMPGGITMIKLKPDATTAKDAELIELYDAAGFQDYCATSLICGPDGTLYYKNDSRNVLAVGVPKATGVMNLINAIGTVSLDSADAVAIARNAYDALPEEDRASVTNYELLTKAEAALAQLLLQEKVESVKTLIADIGTVTKGSGSKIRAARKAYDALTAEQKALITNYSTLTAAERRYDKLTSHSSSGGSSPRPEISVQHRSVTLPPYTAAPASISLMDRITTLSTSGAYSVAQVVEACKLYAMLTDAQKAEVLNYEVLEAQMAALGKQNHLDASTGIALDGADWNIKLNVLQPPSADEQHARFEQSLGSNVLLTVWDISLSDILTGEGYTPDLPVTLRMPAPDLDSCDDIMIAHYRDDGIVEYLDCAVTEGELSWQAAGFSCYGLVRKGDEAALPLPETAELPVLAEPVQPQPPAPAAPPAAPLPWAWIITACLSAVVIAIALLAKSGKIFAKP